MRVRVSLPAARKMEGSSSRREGAVVVVVVVVVVVGYMIPRTADADKVPGWGGGRGEGCWGGGGR